MSSADGNPCKGFFFFFFERKRHAGFSLTLFNLRNHGNGEAEDPRREEGAAFVAELGSHYGTEQLTFEPLQTDMIGRWGNKQTSKYSQIYCIYLIVVEVQLKQTGSVCKQSWLLSRKTMYIRLTIIFNQVLQIHISQKMLLLLYLGSLTHDQKLIHLKRTI